MAALLKRCADLASLSSCSHLTGATKAIGLIQKAVVTTKTVEVLISSDWLQDELGVGATSGHRKCKSYDQRVTLDEDTGHDEDAIDTALRVVVTSHLLQCGKQVKLLLGSEPDEPSKANPQLVDMIVRTRRWYEGLSSGRYPTLRSIAAEERCDKS